MNLQGLLSTRSNNSRTQAKASSQSSKLMLGLPALLLCSTVLVGCEAGAKTAIFGKVIAGPVGQSMAASPQDLRFDKPGIPEANVYILTKNGNASLGRGVLSKATSDQLGEFEISFGGGQFPGDAVQVRVEGEGFYTSRSVTYLPTEGGQLLCVVITRPGYVAPEPPE